MAIFLFLEKRIDPTIIMSNIRILNLNLDSIRARTEILEANGIQLDTCVSALGKTPESFKSFVIKNSTLDPVETKENVRMINSLQTQLSVENNLYNLLCRDKIKNG